MSADESAMLDTLRRSLNISADDHMQIEHDVRSELSGIEPNNSNNGSNSSNDANGVGNPSPQNPSPEPEAQNVPSPESPQPGLGQPPAPMQPPPPEQPPAPPEPAEPPADEGANEGDQIKDLLNSGKNDYHKGNYEHAIECCDKVLLLDPENSEALFFRKRALSKIEKLRGTKDKSAKKSVSAEASAKPEPEAVAADVGGDNPKGAKSKIEPGSGDPNCKSCGGSGQCHWCKNSGQCYWCKGSGKCDKCGGEGKIGDEDCKACKSSGKCHSCNGDGECYWCKGSGKCSKCSM